MKELREVDISYGVVTHPAEQVFSFYVGFSGSWKSKLWCTLRHGIFSFTIKNNEGALVPVLNLTELQEEELFQQSTVWEYDIDIEFVARVQELAIEVLSRPDTIQDKITLHRTIQY